jgi:hypothetical protein
MKTALSSFTLLTCSGLGYNINLIFLTQVSTDKLTGTVPGEPMVEEPALDFE